MVVHYSNKDESRPAILPLPWSAIAMVCMSVAIVTAVGGNILVVLSYMRDRRLRTVHNLYLLHLAVCDLTIGSVSMPLYFIYTVQYWRWTLGEGLCKVFLVEDSIVCFMAAQIVALVAWDRLALLTLGSSYQVVETRKRAYIKLAICWVIGFLINSPGIILWDVLSGHSVIPVDECDVEYKDNFVYVMVTQFLSFLLPFASLAAITSLMVVVWEKRMKVRPTAVPRLKIQQASQSGEVSGKGTVECAQHSAYLQETTIKTPSTRLEIFPSSKSNMSSIHSRPDVLTRSGVSDFQTAVQRPQATSTSATPKREEEVKKSHKQPVKTKQRRKTTVIMAGLVLAMAVFWLPYTICTIILSVHKDYVDNFLREVFAWWLWTKSCVNPFLYAYNAPLFRYNIQQLLSRVLPCKFSNRR